MATSFQTITLLAFGTTLLLYVFRKYYWRQEAARRTLLWTLALLLLAVAGKYAISGYGYVPNRMLIYALPVPRLDGLPWLFVIAGCGLAVALWYRHKLRWPRWQRLVALWLVCTLFAIAVGSLRQGIAGVAEPFTRTQWEYISDARLVQSIPQFLRDYVGLVPQLSMHGTGHPPGNALVLYLLLSAFGDDALTLALLIVLIGSALVFPVFHFWRRFLPAEDVENMLPVFMLTPAIVAFTATCMDILVPLFFWTALLLCVSGWQNSPARSFAGGLAAGLALLLNFQFLIFGAVILFFFLHTLLRAPAAERSHVLLRGVASAAGLLSFYGALYVAFDYSIVANFLAAHQVHYAVVDAGAPAVRQYLLFALSNVSGFFVYLGITHLVLFALYLRTRGAELRVSSLYLAGFGMVALLVGSGIYQAEVERLWLFLPPLFLPAMLRALQSSALPRGAILALLLYQVVSVEVLFHTYW